jgi:hypothetical protein
MISDLTAAKASKPSSLRPTQVLESGRGPITIDYSTLVLVITERYDIDNKDDEADRR